MTILDTYIINGQPITDLVIVSIILGLGLGTVVAINLAEPISPKKVIIPILLGLFVSVAFFFILFKTDEFQDITVHHAVFSDDSDISIEEFINNYEIIDHDGDVLVVSEVEDNG